MIQDLFNNKALWTDGLSCLKIRHYYIIIIIISENTISIANENCRYSSAGATDFLSINMVGLDPSLL